MEEEDFTPARAMRTSAFWMLVLATSFRVAGLSAVMVHFIPIMVWKGVSEGRAALLLSTFALLSLPSHLLVGWIADYIYKPRLMGLCMLVATAAVGLLIYGEAEGSLWLFTILFTVTEAIFPVGWATVGDFYGRRFFATIRGAMSFFYMWGAVAAPVAAGLVYDRTQSYSAMLSVLLALFITSAFLYALLVRPTTR